MALVSLFLGGGFPATFSLPFLLDDLSQAWFLPGTPFSGQVPLKFLLFFFFPMPSGTDDVPPFSPCMNHFTKTLQVLRNPETIVLSASCIRRVDSWLFHPRSQGSTVFDGLFCRFQKDVPPTSPQIRSVSPWSIFLLNGSPPLANCPMCSLMASPLLRRASSRTRRSPSRN